MTHAEILSQPLSLPNGVVLPNRLVKSAMSEALGTLDGHPTASLERLYGRWADGGIGLSITGNVMIDRRALGEPGNVVIEDDRDLELFYEAPVMTGARKLRDSTRKREAYFHDFAEKARAAIRVPLMLTGGFRTAEGMANAISSGAVDLVGLARSLAIEPDLPKRILAGLPPRHEVKPISTGFKFIDKIGFMEITWYTHQIQRIGHGQDPHPDECPLVVFMLNALRICVSAFKMRRMRA